MRSVPASRTCPATNERLASRFGDELLQRDTEERQLVRIGLDADLLRIAAGDVAQPDIVDLGQFGPQLVSEFVEVLIGPAALLHGLWPKRHHHDRYVVDTVADDQWLGNSDRHV